MTDRNVLDVTPGIERKEAKHSQPFSDFAGHVNLVLLGDPGAGKTHLFEAAAEASGGRYLKARSFLLLPVFPRDATLFIDGLDETRAGRGDQDTINAFVKKLFEVRPAKLRISCRVADWLGDTDLAAFNLYFQDHGGVTVLALQTLSPVEQKVVLMAERPSGDPATSAQAIEFLGEAERRGLQEFTLNPQNLLMLWDSVKEQDVWPTTRHELFELSTQLLLAEHNLERQRSGSGTFAPHELRDAAGALCAMRLLSDVEGISLREGGDGPDFPSYRSLSFVAPEKAQAALGRRVFVAGPNSETRDYAHRTTAEFLGAGWISAQVRRGLPIGRVLALLGVDGHPASELRGLHAWVAVNSPENANRLIETDPYGVLTYGDAASLSPATRKHLLEAIACLSEKDPWFRSGSWDSLALGMLARPDMVEAFRATLNSPTANFGLRSVVVDALAAGVPLPEMLPDLATVLAREKSTFSERASAMTALERLGKPGTEAIVRFCNDKPLNTENALRLRALIISRLFGSHFVGADVVTLLDDAVMCSTLLAAGTLWVIDEALPISDIPAVLNAIQSLPSTEAYPELQRRNLSQVARTIGRMLFRYLKGAGKDATAIDVLRWLKLIHAIGATRQGSQGKEIASELRARPKLLRAMFRLYFDALPIQEASFAPLFEFQSFTLGTITQEELSCWMIESLNSAKRGSSEAKLLFQFALMQCWTEAPWGAARFEELSSIALVQSDLKSIYDEMVCIEIPEWRRSDAARDVARSRKNARDLEQTVKNFGHAVHAIRSGNDVGWLAWAARIYFAEFEDIDVTLAPLDRLRSVIGEDYCAVALDGFAALLQRPDIPAPIDVAKISVCGQVGTWWIALLAGLEEAWNRRPDTLTFSDDFWRSLLAIQLVNPIFETADRVTRERSQAWQKAILEARPNLARDAYEAIARVYLAANHQHIEGLHQLLHEPALVTYRDDVALALLEAFPFPTPYALTDLLGRALAATERRDDYLPIVRSVVEQSAGDHQDLWDRWLVSGYLLSPNEFASTLQARFLTKREIAWLLRDLVGSDHGSTPSFPLTIAQAEVIASLVGASFPNAYSPSGTFNGNANAWDAADFVRSLVNMISTASTVAAGEALERLAGDPTLASYQDAIRHALAAQRARFRDARYCRPNWDDASTAMVDGSPANVADLCALAVAQLEDIAIHIRSANTDIYKQFWNVDSYGRLTEPRPEETSRDALLTLLKPRMNTRGVMAEPEGHMADDKRADIVVAKSGTKVVIELKKDTHREVWSAAQEQLDRFYTRDPEAKGFGIYGVFWFGDTRKGKLPTPPAGSAEPKTAVEMARTLGELLPESVRARIAVVVFDVSSPGETTSLSSRAG